MFIFLATTLRVLCLIWLFLSYGRFLTGLILESLVSLQLSMITTIWNPLIFCHSSISALLSTLLFCLDSANSILICLPLSKLFLLEKLNSKKQPLFDFDSTFASFFYHSVLIIFSRCIPAAPFEKM